MCYVAHMTKPKDETLKERVTRKTLEVREAFLDLALDRVKAAAGALTPNKKGKDLAEAIAFFEASTKGIIDPPDPG